MKKIAVIGGGIIGLTLANYLDTTKFAVTVYDEGLGQATKASAGIISPWLSKRRNQKWYALARDGAAFYQKLVSDFKLEPTVYKKSGTLILRKSQDVAELSELATERKKTAPAIGEIQLLTAEETAERNPLLKPQPSLLIDGGARLDGKACLQQLRKIAAAKGIQFIPEKATVQRKASAYEVLSPQTGKKDFDFIAFTNGPHLPNSLEPLGYLAKVRPQKGQLLVFQTNFSTSGNWPVAMLDGESDLIPFENGKILVGATHENNQGFDLEATPAAFADLQRKTLPFLAEAALFSQPYHYRVGTRAYTEDFAPFFNCLPADPAIAVASGLGSSGLTTGPLIGFLLAKYFNEGSNDWQQYQKPLKDYLAIN
ncbi:NAD(P)/FAD-dependent oxidoreductase [Enterococcus sp. LJL120]